VVDLIAIVEMTGAGILEVHGLFDEAAIGVESRVALVKIAVTGCCHSPRRRTLVLLV
jgi:hypothetical protein